MGEGGLESCMLIGFGVYRANPSEQHPDTQRSRERIRVVSFRARQEDRSASNRSYKKKKIPLERML